MTSYDYISFIRNSLVSEMASLIQYNWEDSFRITKLNTCVQGIKAIIERDSGSPDVDITELTFNQAVELGFRPWDESGLMLIPLYLFEFLKPGTEVIDIFGENEILTENYREEVDDDHRFGCLAFGIKIEPEIHCSNHVMVETFNHQVLGVEKREVSMMPDNEFRLSLRQLREEIDEIEQAYQEENLIGVLDGLIDLDYFHKGVIYKHGVSEEVYNKLFRAVHQANMEKKLGVKSTRQGFDGAADAVKPEDWVPPEDRLLEILMEDLSDGS